MDIDEINFIKLKNKPKVHYILQNTTLLHLGFQFFSLAALKNWKLKLLSLKKTLIKPSDSASNPFPFLKLSVPFSCFPVHMNKRHAFCKLTHETLRSKTIFRPCRSIQRVELRWDFEKKTRILLETIVFHRIVRISWLAHASYFQYAFYSINLMLRKFDTRDIRLGVSVNAIGKISQYVSV